MAIIYPTLISKIQTILDGIGKIKVVYAYPATKIDNYPAAIFFPSSMENNFSGNQDNMKEYTFKIFIVVGAQQKSVQSLYSTVLPNAVDAFIEGFDVGWDFDTIDGHRVWQRLEAGTWAVNETQDGLEVSAEFDLVVKMLTDV